MEYPCKTEVIPLMPYLSFYYSAPSYYQKTKENKKQPPVKKQTVSYRHSSIAICRIQLQIRPAKTPMKKSSPQPKCLEKRLIFLFSLDFSFKNSNFPQNISFFQYICCIPKQGNYDADIAPSQPHPPPNANL